jgi:hypothetical protein
MAGVKVVRFIFEACTDMALIPALGVMAARGRHFELFMGLLQWGTSTAYNICDALDIQVFLTRTQWHRLNNIASVTFVGLLLLRMYTPIRIVA